MALNDEQTNHSTATGVLAGAGARDAPYLPWLPQSSDGGNSQPACSPQSVSRRRHLSVRPMEVQEWINKRFADITVDMFCAEDIDAGKIAIYSTHQLIPPPGFEDVWFPIGTHHSQGRLLRNEIEYLSNAAAVLLFSDVQDPVHSRRAFDVSSSIVSLESNAPPVILLPHSTLPATPAGEDKKAAQAGIEDMDLLDIPSMELQVNIDVIVFGQPAGVALAGEVYSRILNQTRTASMLNRKLNERREVIRKAQMLEDDLDDAVWEYCRVRLRSGLPAIDDAIGPGQPDTIDNFVVGAKLGQGSFGLVCRLVEPGNPNGSSGQVLKMVSKKPLTSFYGIVSLKRELRVMGMLSTEEHSHINIAQLYQVYHTETHIMLRIEDGGKLDLYKRLALREQRTPPFPLGAKKATDTIRQCMAGVCHLHLGPQVVHRDLKPENIIVNEVADRIAIKITDFDVALASQPGRTKCTGKVGTFPFMAPEIILENSFDPFAADIWSIAIVILEVICRLNLLKKGLSLYSNKKMSRKAEEELHMGKIRAFFKTSSNVNMLLHKFIQLEMNYFEDDANTLLTGMLNTKEEERMTAREMREMMAGKFFEFSDAVA